MFDSNIRPISELPADADLNKSEWSWYFAEGKGGIRHSRWTGEQTTYVFPLAIVQVIEAVSKQEGLRVQDAIKRALGITPL